MANNKSNAWENALLLLLFNNTNAANIGDATGLRGSSTAGSLYISLYIADPTESGSQTSNEATYASYARVAVARSGAGFTISTNTVTNASAITFPTCTGGTNTITHFGIGTDISGTGTLLYSGELSTPLVVSTGITPEFAAGDLDGSED